MKNSSPVFFRRYDPFGKGMDFRQAMFLAPGSREHIGKHTISRLENAISALLDNPSEMIEPGIMSQAQMFFVEKDDQLVLHSSIDECVRHADDIGRLILAALDPECKSGMNILHNWLNCAKQFLKND